jgi:hypothetical protein
MRIKTLVAVVTVLLLAIALAACGSGGGGGGTPQQTSVKLAQTGQTVCYDAAGAVVACAGTGQDGDKLAGVAWPTPRFTNLDGTTPVTGSVVVDQLTGLMWLKDANCISTDYASFDNDGTAGDGAVTWQHALDFVAGINAGTYPNCGGGYTDWRLPNRKELRSLANYGQMNSATWLNTQGFSNVQANGYWSSTTYAGDTTSAWYVNMYYGIVNASNKANNDYVWPVRSGQ